MKKRNSAKENSEEFKRNKKKGPVLRNLIIGLVILLLAYTAYYYFFSKTENKEISTEQKKTENVQANTPNTTENKTPKQESEKKLVPKPDSKYAGKYQSVVAPLSYRELKDDGTFYAKDGPMKGGGTYKIDGKEITFHYDNGMIAVSEIGNGKIQDQDKELWVQE